MVKFNRFKDGKLRALTMSFDDGRQQDNGLVEMFNRYGIKGSFHLNSVRYQQKTDEELREIAKIYEGHEVSCHTVHHPFLENMPVALMTREIVEDREILEKMCGYIVRGMSYPFGTYSPTVIEAMKAGGMLYSRTVGSNGQFKMPQDFMMWHPTTHFGGDIDGLWERFVRESAWTSLPVYYIWGHSYELDSIPDKWATFEAFCAKVSEDKDTWFTTNIEIYDYVQALRGLQFSWNRRLVYNPSATTVWFESGGEVVCVKGGETKDLGEGAEK